MSPDHPQGRVSVGFPAERAAGDAVVIFTSLTVLFAVAFRAGSASGAFSLGESVLVEEEVVEFARSVVCFVVVVDSCPV